MKQKYLVLKSEDNSELIIREFAELDKDAMSLLCEETYDDKKIASAIKQGPEALIDALRTPNMYPAGVYVDKIADSVIDLYKDKEQGAVEVFFDDSEYISTSRKRAAKAEIQPSESDQMEEIIDEEFDEEYDEKPVLNKLNSTIKVNEDELSEYDEDS